MFCSPGCDRSCPHGDLGEEDAGEGDAGYGLVEPIMRFSSSDVVNRSKSNPWSCYNDQNGVSPAERILFLTLVSMFASAKIFLINAVESPLIMCWWYDWSLNKTHIFHLSHHPSHRNSFSASYVKNIFLANLLLFQLFTS